MAHQRRVFNLQVWVVAQTVSNTLCPGSTIQLLHKAKAIGCLMHYLLQFLLVS
jgi:hypothetical protein